MRDDPPDQNEPYDWAHDSEWGDKDPDRRTWLLLLAATLALAIGFLILYRVAADLP